MQKKNPTPPFRFETAQRAANREFTFLVAARFASFRDNYVSSDNMLKYSHGGGWQTNYPTALDNEGKFKEFSAETNLRFEDVVNHCVPTLLHILHELSEAMQRQFVTSLFDLINDTTERTGNVVSVPEAGSNAKAFLQMLEAVEFGVDRNGNVTMPNIHAGANMVERFIQDLEAEGPEFSQKVEQIKAAKTEAARLREAERRAKFVTRVSSN